MQVDIDLSGVRYVNELFHEKFAILHMQKQEQISCEVTYAAISAMFFCTLIVISSYHLPVCAMPNCSLRESEKYWSNKKKVLLHSDKIFYSVSVRQKSCKD